MDSITFSKRKLDLIPDTFDHVLEPHRKRQMQRNGWGVSSARSTTTTALENDNNGNSGQYTSVLVAAGPRKVAIPSRYFQRISSRRTAPSAAELAAIDDEKIARAREVGHYQVDPDHSLIGRTLQELKQYKAENANLKVTITTIRDQAAGAEAKEDDALSELKQVKQQVEVDRKAFAEETRAYEEQIQALLAQKKNDEDMKARLRQRVARSSEESSATRSEISRLWNPTKKKFVSKTRYSIYYGRRKKNMTELNGEKVRAVTKELAARLAEAKRYYNATEALRTDMKGLQSEENSAPTTVHNRTGVSDEDAETAASNRNEPTGGLKETEKLRKEKEPLPETGDSILNNNEANSTITGTTLDSPKSDSNESKIRKLVEELREERDESRSKAQQYRDTLEGLGYDFGEDGESDETSERRTKNDLSDADGRDEDSESRDDLQYASVNGLDDGHNTLTDSKPLNAIDSNEDNGGWADRTNADTEEEEQEIDMHETSYVGAPYGGDEEGHSTVDDSGLGSSIVSNSGDAAETGYSFLNSAANRGLSENVESWPGASLTAGIIDAPVGDSDTGTSSVVSAKKTEFVWTGPKLFGGDHAFQGGFGYDANKAAPNEEGDRLNAGQTARIWLDPAIPSHRSSAEVKGANGTRQISGGGEGTPSRGSEHAAVPQALQEGSRLVQAHANTAAFVPSQTALRAQQKTSRQPSESEPDPPAHRDHGIEDEPDVESYSDLPELMDETWDIPETEEEKDAEIKRLNTDLDAIINSSTKPSSKQSKEPSVSHWEENQPTTHLHTSGHQHFVPTGPGMKRNSFDQGLESRRTTLPHESTRCSDVPTGPRSMRPDKASQSNRHAAAVSGGGGGDRVDGRGPRDGGPRAGFDRSRDKGHEDPGRLRRGHGGPNGFGSAPSRPRLMRNNGIQQFHEGGGIMKASRTANGTTDGGSGIRGGRRPSIHLHQQTNGRNTLESMGTRARGTMSGPPADPYAEERLMQAERRGAVKNGKKTAKTNGRKTSRNGTEMNGVEYMP